MSDHVSQLAALIEAEMHWQENLNESKEQLDKLDADDHLLRGYVKETIDMSAKGLKAATRKRAAFEESITRLGLNPE